MGLIFFLLILVFLFLWWFTNTTHTLDQRGTRGVLRSPQHSNNASSTFQRDLEQLHIGPSNPRLPHVLRKPEGDCICGCNGVPLSFLPEYSIDYHQYKTCPARMRRKRTGIYIDDTGQVAHWDPGGQQQRATTRRRRNAKKKQRKEGRKQENLALRREHELQRHARAEQEKLRSTSGAPAQGAAEALRRGLDTYIGKECGVGHSGERLTRNGECVECRRIDQRKRDAMRRGAYPRDLTPQEKKRIGEIYAEARQLTQQTGILHHVDHIKPLAAGGEHHPSNLRVITAEENLNKGAKWDGSAPVSKPDEFTHTVQEELDLGVYRNLGVRRKDNVS